MCIPLPCDKVLEDVNIRADTKSVCCNNNRCESSCCCFPFFRPKESSPSISESQIKIVRHVHHKKHKHRHKSDNTEKINHFAIKSLKIKE